MIYSKGYPYRKPLYNNRLLCGSLIICTAISIWWSVRPPPVMVTFLNLMMPPMMEFRLFILTLAALCFILCLLCEKWVVDFLLLDLRDRKKLCCKGERPEKYLALMREVGHSHMWLSSALERRKRRSLGSPGSPPAVWNNYGATSLSSSSADEESTLLSARKDKRLGQTVL